MTNKPVKIETKFQIFIVSSIQLISNCYRSIQGYRKRKGRDRNCPLPFYTFQIATCPLQKREVQDSIEKILLFTNHKNFRLKAFKLGEQ